MSINTLTINQRAIVVGDEGICPECEKEIEFKDIDKNWWICNNCVQELTMPNNEDNKDYNKGYSEGLANVLKSILTHLIESNDDCMDQVREAIHQIEQDQNVRF